MCYYYYGYGKISMKPSLSTISCVYKSFACEFDLFCFARLCFTLFFYIVHCFRGASLLFCSICFALLCFALLCLFCVVLHCFTLLSNSGLLWSVAAEATTARKVIAGSGEARALRQATDKCSVGSTVEGAAALLLFHVVCSCCVLVCSSVY